MFHLRTCFCVGLLAAIGMSSAVARGDEAGSKALGDLIQTYKNLSSYSDEGKLTNAFVVDGKSEKLETASRIAFARPNKLRYESDIVSMVSDGTNLATLIDPAKKFLKGSTPEKFTLEVLAEGPLGALFSGHLTGVPASPVPYLLLSADPAKAIKDAGLTPTLGKNEKVDGVDCKTIVLNSQRGFVLKYAIDAKSGLLHSVDLSLAEKDRVLDSAPGHVVKIESMRWKAGKVDTKGADAKVFAFTPPAGFTQIAKLEELEGPTGPAAESNLVGKPAPNFSVATLDGPGKLGRVKLDDLKGNVVLIDFWATWCGPCMKELPEVQKMIEGYVKDKKPVKVLAVSLDDSEDGELKGPRELVEKTLKEQKIVLDGNPVGTIALDPTGTMGRAYGASAIPMVLLLDTKGVVQAVHVGYTEREVLEKEIATLLDGKPLAKPAK